MSRLATSGTTARPATCLHAAPFVRPRRDICQAGQKVAAIELLHMAGRLLTQPHSPACEPRCTSPDAPDWTC